MERVLDLYFYLAKRNDSPRLLLGGLIIFLILFVIGFLSFYNIPILIMAAWFVIQAFFLSLLTVFMIISIEITSNEFFEFSFLSMIDDYNKISKEETLGDTINEKVGD